MRVKDFDQIYSDVHNKAFVTFNQESTREKVSTEPKVTKIHKLSSAKENDFVNKLRDTDLQDLEELLNEDDISLNKINDKIVEALLTSAWSTFGLKEATNRKILIGDQECHKKGGT